MGFILPVHVLVDLILRTCRCIVRTDIGNSNSHLRENFFFSLLAQRKGPRWRAAELVHSCRFFSKHMLTVTMPPISQKFPHKGILWHCNGWVCVDVCTNMYNAVISSVWHYVIWSCSGIVSVSIYPSCISSYSFYGQRSGRSISQHAVEARENNYLPIACSGKTSGCQSVARLMCKQTKTLRGHFKFELNLSQMALSCGKKLM